MHILSEEADQIKWIYLFFLYFDMEKNLINNDNLIIIVSDNIKIIVDLKGKFQIFTIG